MIRVVLIPSPSVVNPRASSAYWLFVDMCRHRDPNFHFFWYVPKSAAAEIAKDIPPENTTVVEYETERDVDFLQADMWFPFDDFKKKFSWFYGEHVVDAVFCQNANLAFRLFRTMADPRRMTYEPNIFIIEQKFMEDAELKISDLLMMNYMLGYAVSSTVFLSTLETKTVREYARKYLSASMVDKMLSQSTVLPVPVNCTRIREWTAGLTKDEKFTLFFGGRINKGKNTEFVLDEYDWLFKSGKPIRVVVTTGSHPRAGIIDENYKSYVDFKFDMDREKYLKEAARAHVFISASKTSGFPVAWFEQIYAGLVGLMPTRDWVDHVVPFEYPFKYKSHVDLQGLFREIMSDYPAAQKKMDVVRKWIEEQASTEVVIPKYLDFIKKRVDATSETWGAHRVGAQFDFMKDVVGSLKEGEEISFDALLDVCREKGEAFELPVSVRSKVYNKYEIHSVVCHLGMADVGGKTPVYRRVASVTPAVTVKEGV